MAETAVVSLVEERAAVDAAIATYANRYLAGIASPVSDAVHYALLGEGKRFRALLLIAAYRAVVRAEPGDAPREHPTDGAISALAAAVEVVHAYSLVHDDLPCMDNDNVRRGRPTVHRVYGVPAATAAGLAMVPLAARCAWNAALALRLPRGRCADIVKELMRASGAGGMVGGQLLDLEGEGLTLSLDQLERIHHAKTGALIAASVRIGAMAGRATAAELSAFDAFGEAVGLAFQIADDVLDVTATSDQLGKTAGRDAAMGKSTYPAVMGVEQARGRATALIDGACAGLRGAGLLTPALDEVARYVVARRN